MISSLLTTRAWAHLSFAGHLPVPPSVKLSFHAQLFLSVWFLWSFRGIAQPFGLWETFGNFFLWGSHLVIAPFLGPRTRCSISCLKRSQRIPSNPWAKLVGYPLHFFRFTISFSPTINDYTFLATGLITKPWSFLV